MKKIYLTIFTLILCGSMFGQSALNVQLPTLEQAKLAPNTKAPIKNNSINRGGPFSAWFEPVGDVMTQKGLLLDGSASADQGLFLSVINCDSTVQVSSPTSTRAVSAIFTGSVLDPKSTNLQPSLDPIVTYADAYTVDSLLILGSYVKATPTVDTLYVTLVWGDTADASVFVKRNNPWQAPMMNWRQKVIGPLLSGAAGGPGNLVQAAAPAGNKMLIKYPLANTDSVLAGYLKYINIPLPSPASIPAGNIVSCMVTFVPGAAQTLNAVAYGFTGGQPQTTNGFGLAVWNQKNPPVTTINDYQDHQVDPTSFCMGTLYQKGQRHATTGWNGYWNDNLGLLTSAPVILYKISGASTVGVNELGNEFVLGQNSPNPFGDKTIINYQIKNTASTVAFEIYDIKGSKVYENKGLDSKLGNHKIELNNQFTAGIYFYSLIVDGKKVTKKMVITT